MTGLYTNHLQDVPVYFLCLDFTIFIEEDADLIDYVVENGSKMFLALFAIWDTDIMHKGLFFLSLCKSIFKTFPHSLKILMLRDKSLMLTLY